MPQSIALVLSSGGARGYAHIGVIEALESACFSIGSIAGCSMGAVVGGIYAAGGLEKFRQWAYSLDRTDLFKLYDFVFSSQGLIRGERVFKQIESYIPDVNIEDLPIPFKAIATDVHRQKEVVFDNGSLFNALRASSAIPAVVKPTEYDGLQLMDGGILNPLPINFVDKKPGDIIVAVDVNANIPYDSSRLTTDEIAEETKFKLDLDGFAQKWFHRESQNSNTAVKKLGFFDLLMKSIDMMQDRIVENMIQKYPPELLIQVSRSTCSTFDYYKARVLVKEGLAATRLALESYKERSNVES